MKGRIEHAHCEDSYKNIVLKFFLTTEIFIAPWKRTNKWLYLSFPCKHHYKERDKDDWFFSQTSIATKTQSYSIPSLSRFRKKQKKKKKPKYKILIYLNEIHPKQLNLMLLSMYQSFRHTHTYKTNKRRKNLKINKILIYLNEIHHKQLDFPIAYDKIE